MHFHVDLNVTIVGKAKLNLILPIFKTVAGCSLTFRTEPVENSLQAFEKT